jgi:hypothetical protein
MPAQLTKHKETGDPLLDNTTCSDLLEHVLDGHGLSDTLTMLSEVAARKSEHVGSNWQDAELARRWNSVSRKLDKIARLEVFKTL